MYGESLALGACLSNEYLSLLAEKKILENMCDIEARNPFNEKYSHCGTLSYFVFVKQACKTTQQKT